MKLMMRDGRVFEGTALEVFKAMQDSVRGRVAVARRDMDWVVDNARRFEGVELVVTGMADRARAW